MNRHTLSHTHTQQLSPARNKKKHCIGKCAEVRGAMALRSVRAACHAGSTYARPAWQSTGAVQPPVISAEGAVRRTARLATVPCVTPVLLVTCALLQLRMHGFAAQGGAAASLQKRLQPYMVSSPYW